MQPHLCIEISPFNHTAITVTDFSKISTTSPIHAQSMFVTTFPSILFAGSFENRQNIARSLCFVVDFGSSSFENVRHFYEHVADAYTYLLTH